MIIVFDYGDGVCEVVACEVVACKVGTTPFGSFTLWSPCCSCHEEVSLFLFLAEAAGVAFKTSKSIAWSGGSSSWLCHFVGGGAGGSSLSAWIPDSL